MNDDGADAAQGSGETDADAADRSAAAEARAAILARRVATLEAVVAVERRMRDVQEMAARAANGLPDVTVPRPRNADRSVDDDATIPVPHYQIDDDATRPVHPVVPRTTSLSTPLSTPLSISLSRPVAAHEPEPTALVRTVGGHAATPLALPAGFRLLEYRIDAVLGQGGFGITYLATDVNLHVKVAIKEYLPAGFATRASDQSVSPRWAEDNNFYLSGLECFLVEARTLASFRHRHIVRVARFFEAHKTAYMVLEYERGRPLKQWWDMRRTPSEQRILAILQPLMDGLQRVHDAGYLHRDIKPDNIYVRKDDGSLVLLDFGAARQTVGGMQAMADVVTPGYAPPEQFRGTDQGPWTDIYALGATIYWMVTGAKPPAAPERENGSAPMVPAMEAGQGRYSVAFLEALDAALSLDPRARPQTMREFARAISAAHAGTLGLKEALLAGEAKAQQRIVKEVRVIARRMWRPARWPLAVKMTVAMVLAALLPMAITGYYNLQGSVAAVSAGEKHNLESIAQSTAGRVGQLMADSRNLANYLATDGTFADYLQQPTAAQEAAVAGRLQSLIRSNPDIHMMYLLDRKGTALVSTQPGMAGANFAFRDYFRNAMQGRTWTTGMIISRTIGEPGVYHASPVFGANRQVVGAVVLRIAGSTIGTILDEMAEHNGRAAFMVDGDGVLVHHADDKFLYRSLAPLPQARLAAIVAEQRFGGRTVPDLGMPELAQALVGAKATGNLSFRSTLSGVDEHAGYAPVKGYGWVIGVSESRTQFEAPLRRLFGNLLASGALVGGVFLVLAVLFSRSITRPIVRLTAAANALKDGKYANVAVTTGDEIGRLTRTFNVMIDVLRQRERERKREE